MAKIMVQYGGPSCSFWAESVRSSCSRTIVGKAIWENLVEVGTKFQIGNVSLFIVKKDYSCLCMCDIKLAGKKQNIDPMWKVLNKEFDLGEPTSFLHSKTMPNKQRYCGQLQNHIRIANFSGGIREITIPSKSSYFFMVLWHGLSCKEVCGTMLWVGKQHDS